MRRLLTATGLLAIVGSIFAVSIASDTEPSRTPIARERPGVQGLDAGSQGSKRPPMPPVKLDALDHRGKPITSRDLKGNRSVFAFVPRRCDGECPAMLDQLRGALDLSRDRAPDVEVVVVPTSRPSESDIERLANWRGLRGRIRVVTGSGAGIARTMDQFKVDLGVNERFAAYLVVVDTDLRQRVAYVTHTLTPEALAADLTDGLDAERP